MSLYTNLLELSLLRKLKPSGALVVLAVIYVGFILRHSLIGLILYFIAIICFFGLGIILLSRDKKHNDSLSWDDDPRIKAIIESNNKKSKQEDKNPYD